MKKQTNDNNRIKYYTSFTTSELEKILKIDFLSANGDHLTNALYAFTFILKFPDNAVNLLIGETLIPVIGLPSA